MVPFIVLWRFCMKTRDSLKKMVLSALFLALAYVMPFLTGQIPEIGSMLCPMHIPVLLCGFLCGGPWGLAVGFIAPLFRSFLTGGFPPFFPTAVCMAFELATYGAAAGFLHRMLPCKKAYIYITLVAAMIIGRVVWGIAMLVCMGINGGAFTLGAFLAGSFTNAIPGIILQIVAIPILVMALERTNLFRQND